MTTIPVDRTPLHRSGLNRSGAKRAVQHHVARVLNLVPDSAQDLIGTSVDEAREILRRSWLGDPKEPMALHGSFALVAEVREKVLLARSLDRPLRYFLAKEADGPLLIVAERIADIERALAEHGYQDQFHPSYTRMVPAHHTTVLRLIGCPDPQPLARRFFDPPMAVLPPDLDLIGERYVRALCAVTREWLAAQDEVQPIGVCFSGGIDSGAVLMALHHELLESGQTAQRLKAFTLRVHGEDGTAGTDAEQALAFLRHVDLEMLAEVIDVDAATLDPYRAIDVIEDYKPLDVECATVSMALLEEIRNRYPEWRLLVDGDGGDENLKDYPIEENSELTIRSVVGNRMLYQEGWGVEAVKHSLTYSGGMSRGMVRTWGPQRHFGFRGFSPFTRPQVIEVAEAIPFDALSEGSHERLYALKGEVIRRGMKRVLEVDFPVYEKRRFQHGAPSEGVFAEVFDVPPETYRRYWLDAKRPA